MSQKIVSLSTEQIGMLKNLINNEAQRLKGIIRGTRGSDQKMVALGETLTSLEQARDPS